MPSNAEDIKKDIDPLFQGYAPLATFSAKIQLTFALGLLPRKTRDKIEVIRRLRNDFAHQWGPIDFTDERCAGRLKLVIDQKSLHKANEEQFAALANTPVTLRLAFVLSVVRIMGY
jgi:DNA-binding MltR family transcriptional regulator